MEDKIVQYGLLDPYYISSEPDEWVVLDEFVVYSSRINREIVVPQWFITDLASIPRSMRWLISVNERHRVAALIHDYGYANIENTDITRGQWDSIFYDFCVLQGVPKWKRNAMTRITRWFGESAFGTDTRLFIPEDHRAWYRTQHPKLNLGN